MKSFVIALLLAGSVCVGPARGVEVIYSTLGSSVPDYDADHGAIISGSSTPFGYEGIAVPFVPRPATRLASWISLSSTPAGLTRPWLS